MRSKSAFLSFTHSLYLSFLLTLTNGLSVDSSQSSSSSSISLGPLSVHFSLPSPPSGYQLLSVSSLPSSLSGFLGPDTGLINSNGDADVDKVFDLNIGLASADIAGLEAVLKDVSDPTSKKYGQYLTEDELVKYVSPKQETKDAISSWLSTHNLTSKPLTLAGDWIQIPSIPIKKANEILGASYQVYVYPDTKRVGLRTLKYSLPEGLKGLVETVNPGGSFDFGHDLSGVESKSNTVTSEGWPSADGVKMRKMRKRQSTPSSTKTSIPSSCATLVTPSCIQQLYGVPTDIPANEDNGLMITGYNDQFAQEADLKNFLTVLRPDVPPETTFTLATIDNGTNTQDPAKAGREANLDIQISYGLVGTSVPVTFLSVGMTDDNVGLGAFQNTANYLLGLKGIGGENGRPTVLSTSYGFNEPDLEPGEMKKLCYSYLQLSALGTSIIFSSGDGGVSGNIFTQCTSNGRFVPSFPSTCPYVTSVGGTTASSTFPSDPSDLETSLFFSSGGFSDVFPRPWYQQSEVEAYQRVLGNNYTNLYNKSGRGFPDIAAAGSNVAIISGGERVRVGGTSTSAPIIAALVALLNNELLAAGRPSLGFLNPLIYYQSAKSPESFNDITSGSNPGCNTTGFAAASGWDPVTGVGSPNFDILSSALNF